MPLALIGFEAALRLAAISQPAPHKIMTVVHGCVVKTRPMM
jgi:hypothetical protein